MLSASVQVRDTDSVQVSGGATKQRQDPGGSQHTPKRTCITFLTTEAETQERAPGTSKQHISFPDIYSDPLPQRRS